MKMQKSFWFIIALSAIMFFSCNNFTGGSIVEKSDAIDGKTKLTLAVEGMFTSTQNPYIYRNMMPTNWTSDKAGALYYVLTGAKLATGENEITSNNTFTYAQLSGGTATILLDSANWYLTLTAYTDEEHTKVALKSSLVEINLSNGANTAVFNMIAPETTTASGSAAITLKFTKPANFDRVVYGIYTGSALSSTVVGEAVTAETTDLTTVNSANNVYSVTYTNSSITAGQYYFNAAFYNSANKVICFYSDLVQIDGGNDTTQSVNLAEGAFNTPAANPTAINVSYSYNDNTHSAMKVAELTATDTINSKYYATFTWNDNSDNETGFELIVTDTADAENPVTYNSASTLTAGSLAASSESATIELDTGHVYTVKIRALNDFTTNSTYLDLSGNVSLFTVAYTLNSGLVMKANDSSTESTVVTYVVPYNSSALAQSLLGSDSSTYPYVYRTSYSFIKWYEASDTSKAAVTEIAANNTANLSLAAYWQSSLGVSINMPDYSTINDYALVDSYTEAAVYTLSGIQSGDTAVTVVLTPNTGLTNVSWTIYNNSDYATEITDNKSVDNTTSVLTWTITDTANSVAVAAGTYRIAVSGTYNETSVSGNIYIKITR